MTMAAAHPHTVVEQIDDPILQNMVLTDPCGHETWANLFDPDTEVCESCMHKDGEWFELRMCLECGFVGCCDDSPSHHFATHAEQMGHVLYRSIEPGEQWVACKAHGRKVGSLIGHEVFR